MTPTPVDPILLRDIRIAYLTQKLAEAQIVQQLAPIKAELQRAFAAAGLDPAKTYSFDLTANTATEVVE